MWQVPTGLQHWRHGYEAPFSLPSIAGSTLSLRWVKNVSAAQLSFQFPILVRFGLQKGGWGVCGQLITPGIGCRAVQTYIQSEQASGWVPNAEALSGTRGVRSGNKLCDRWVCYGSHVRIPLGPLNCSKWVVLFAAEERYTIIVCDSAS